MGLLLEKRRETIRYLSYILCLDYLEMHNIGIKSPQSLFYRAPERRWEFIKENTLWTKKAIKKKRKKEIKHALDQECDQEKTITVKKKKTLEHTKRKTFFLYFLTFLFSYINSHLRLHYTRKNAQHSARRLIGGYQSVITRGGNL